MAKTKSVFTGTEREIPSGKEGPILPARVANQNAAFSLSLARLWNQLLLNLRKREHISYPV